MSIEVRDLWKRFGEFTALRDVNLEVRAGELVALLGPSGSGKTTLLRLIAGLDYPDAGEIRPRDARLVDDLSPELDVPIDHRPRPVLGVTRHDGTRQDASVTGDDAGGELGATDVEGEDAHVGRGRTARAAVVWCHRAGRSTRSAW